MRRLFPLLTLAVLPAALAAPVPAGASRTPEFGATGLVTPADLAQVRFDTRVVTNTDDRPQRDQIQYRGDPPQFDVAVHLPRNRFRSGEVIPAYFVVRNGLKMHVGLDARLEVTDSRITTWNNSDIRVMNLTTKETVGMTEGFRATHGEGVDLQPNGFYCVRGDIGHTWDGKPLLPGDYLVDWRCEKWRSAPVRFTVLPGDPNPKPAHPRNPKQLRYFQLESDPDGERAPAEQGGPFVWAWLELDGVDEGSMASALACGIEGVYAPDPHAIPCRDELAEVFATWTAHPDGDRVTVTLRSSKTNRGVDLEDVPHFALAIESVGECTRERAADRKVTELLASLESRISLPFVVELRLPKNWRETTAVKAGDRVAVLVTSKKPDPPSGVRLKKLVEQQAKDDDAPGAPRDPVWRGLLQTTFAELPLK